MLAKPADPCKNTCQNPAIGRRLGSRHFMPLPIFGPSLGESDINKTWLRCVRQTGKRVCLRSCSPSSCSVWARLSQTEGDDEVDAPSQCRRQR